jgi:L-aspartate oxidase
MTNQLVDNNFDAIVVGAGAAGLYAALCLPEDLKIALIGKDSLPRSASDWAQGGIAAVVDPQDSLDLHIADTLKAGAGLCDRRAVEFLVEQAPERIADLVKLGVAFDRHDGRLALTLEAAHSRPRVLHVADTTGRALVSTLVDRVLARSNITVCTPALALDLWMSEGRCAGISLLYQGRISWVQSDLVVLATGGGGQVYAQTTNPVVSTGDGVAMVRRAGGLLRDLEFIQFHPTALVKPGAPRFLISEAVRGEGAHLTDDRGYRFTFDYHPDGELAPRDVVSRAIVSHLQATAQDLSTGNVWLDLRPIPTAQIEYRFPNIIRVCQQWGIDVFNEPIPVAPAAHYWMGGVYTDLMTATTIPGLYAVGETTSMGVHGANRLASNSLLECIVFGAQLGRIELPQNHPNLDRSLPIPISSTSATIDWPQQLQTIAHIRQELPRLMWETAGISRDRPNLQRGIDTVKSWQQEFDRLAFTQEIDRLQPLQSMTDLTIPESEIRLWEETRNLLDIADGILVSALFRTESRGGHYRSDYPTPDPDWAAHTILKSDPDRSFRPQRVQLAQI